MCNNCSFSIAFALLLTSVAVAGKGGNGKPGGDPPPQPPSVEYSIEFLSLGGPSSRVSDLNNLGQVVGIGRDAAGEYLPYHYDSSTGTMNSLQAMLGGSPWQIISGESGLSFNDAGQLATQVSSDGVTAHAARVTLDPAGGEATVQLISSPVASRISPLDINNSGAITGNYTNASGEGRVFTSADAIGFSDIGTLGGSTRVGAINDAGVVAGESRGSDGARHAFRYTPGGAIENLGTLAGKGGSQFESWGSDINSDGLVVGQADDKNVAGLIRYRAFLAAPGEDMVDLGVLGDGQYSQASSINDDGWVVGSSQITSSKYGGRLPGDFHAFVWSPEFGMARLEDLVVDMPAAFDGQLERALLINNAGQIAGNALWSDGRTEAFLLTPIPPSLAAIAVPEPSAGLLILATSIVCAMMHRRSSGCVATS